MPRRASGAMHELARTSTGGDGDAFAVTRCRSGWPSPAGVALSWFLLHEAPGHPGLAISAASSRSTRCSKQVLLRQVQRVVLRRRSALLGAGLWKGGDVAVIDGLMVNGSARRRLVAMVRFPDGHIYHYAFVDDHSACSCC